MTIEGEENEDESGWKVYFDGAVNFKESGIGAILVSYSGQYYPVAAKLNFSCTNNMTKYEACIMGLRLALDMDVREEWATKNEKIIPYVGLVQRMTDHFQEVKFKHRPRTQNEFADALVTIPSMIQHPDSRYIDPVKIEIKDQPAHCAFVEAEIDGKPWTPDLGLARCVDSIEATRLIEEVIFLELPCSHEWVRASEENLKTRLLRMTMENDCSKFVQKCHKCQIHRDLIKVPPTKLNAITSPWSFASWGMDVIGPIEPAASNKHRFIMVAINYFTKWVETASYASVTKKVVANFVRNNIICRFGIPELIITDNGANLNSHLMKEICAQFQITHRNSTAYRPQMNGAVEAANKNIKKILRKMIDNYKDWHEQFPMHFLGITL
ncbi:uncharacterized protein LOC132043875 [Lycium ferocissimum]|uniref:uncharacterized protein LOC132043875 n=1 Tax=Lycium ferocissimum TaxID=112874 RepID=UPI0028151AAF|nr:uncharacterized protein LOC132043875 [Lycium ferocissimum]